MIIEDGGIVNDIHAMYLIDIFHARDHSFNASRTTHQQLGDMDAALPIISSELGVSSYCTDNNPHLIVNHSQ
jgi:hypothetical protein